MRRIFDNDYGTIEIIVFNLIIYTLVFYGTSYQFSYF
jgi:hypothetical protein